MPAYTHIDRYHDELSQLIEFDGLDNEENIRLAFQNCLVAYCADRSEQLVLVPELRFDSSNKPHGTTRESLRMTPGLWEAKDAHDDLDHEIQSKFNRGYPRDYIVFGHSKQAVLFQNRTEATRVDMARPGRPLRLTRRFLDDGLPEVEEFRHTRRHSKGGLSAVLENLPEASAGT